MRRSSGREPLTFARSPRDRTRAGGPRRAMRTLVLLAVVAGLAGVAVLFAWAGTARPRASLAAPIEVVGRRTPAAIEIEAGRPGLRSWEVRLETAAGAHTIASGEVPRSGLLGSGERRRRVDVEIDAAASGIAEGEARLVVLADDYGPLAWLRGRTEALSLPVRVDLTPPKLTLLSGQVRAAVGGSAIAVYTTSADTVRSGVQVGSAFFPGRAGVSPDAAVHVALFAIPHDQDARVVPKLVAADAAGNRREHAVPAIVKPTRFPTEEIALGEDFLRVKIPDLIAQNGLVAPSDPVAAYLLVNRDLRRTTEERLREITGDTAPKLLFDGPFLQQPGTAVGSRFAERRTYRYEGRVIDEQTHLGTDLASVKQDPVIASNSGTVLFVGDLGIYGQSVVLDHGLGLASLYAHLSQASVSPGQTVARGDQIGRTGETGLAAGDHLHFSILVSGIHVDPVEWWDGKWIRDHIQPELASATGASGAAPAGAAAAPAPDAATAPGAAASPAVAGSPAAASPAPATTPGSR